MLNAISATPALIIIGGICVGAMPRSCTAAERSEVESLGITKIQPLALNSGLNKVDFSGSETNSSSANSVDTVVTEKGILVRASEGTSFSRHDIFFATAAGAAAPSVLVWHYDSGSAQNNNRELFKSAPNVRDIPEASVAFFNGRWHAHQQTFVVSAERQSTTRDPEHMQVNIYYLEISHDAGYPGYLLGYKFELLDTYITDYLSNSTDCVLFREFVISVSNHAHCVVNR